MVSTAKVITLRLILFCFPEDANICFRKKSKNRKAYKNPEMSGQFNRNPGFTYLQISLLVLFYLQYENHVFSYHRLALGDDNANELHDVEVIGFTYHSTNLNKVDNDDIDLGHALCSSSRIVQY